MNFTRMRVLDRGLEQELVSREVDSRWMMSAAGNLLGTRCREGCFERIASSVLFGRISHSFDDVCPAELDVARLSSRSPPMPRFGCISGSDKTPLTPFVGVLQSLFGRISQFRWQVLVSSTTRCWRRGLAALLPHRWRCILVSYPMGLRQCDHPTRFRLRFAFRLPSVLSSRCSSFRARICNGLPGKPASMCMFAQASRLRTALCIFPSPVMHQFGVFGDRRDCIGTKHV